MNGTRIRPLHTSSSGTQSQVRTAGRLLIRCLPHGRMLPAHQLERHAVTGAHCRPAFDSMLATWAHVAGTPARAARSHRWGSASTPQPCVCRLGACRRRAALEGLRPLRRFTSLACLGVHVRGKRDRAVACLVASSSRHSDRPGFVTPALHASLTLVQVITDDAGGMLAKYYLLEAGMVDLSCRGKRMFRTGAVASCQSWRLSTAGGRC